MKRFNLLNLIAVITAIFVTIILACNTPVNSKESITTIESIPDSVIQFLITSAATDFNEHHPPTVMDLRNVKAGYISSGNERTYLICGEFLSQEKKDWKSFTTIKTSGYEQYIGDNPYCQKATFVETGSNRLSEEIKNKLTELGK
jgi:hypothetical protein